MNAASLRGALSDRAREGRVHVVSAFVDGDAPKTKAALATLNAVTQAKRVLVVLDRDDVLNWVSLRNAPQVHLIEAGQLNTYDVLRSEEHTSELQSRQYLVCRLLLEKKKKNTRLQIT